MLSRLASLFWCVANVTNTYFANSEDTWISGWWFEIFLYFHPYLGKWSSLTSIFFRWVETTNQISTTLPSGLLFPELFSGFTVQDAPIAESGPWALFIPEVASVDLLGGCWCGGGLIFLTKLDVSVNRGTPKIIHFNRVFHYKHFGVPLFLETPSYFNLIVISSVFFETRENKDYQSTAISRNNWISQSFHPMHFAAYICKVMFKMFPLLPI